MNKLLLATAPILFLSAAGAMADTAPPEVQLGPASARVMLAAGDRSADSRTSPDPSQKSNDPAMVAPDASTPAFKQKESVTYEIDEKAGPNRPNVQKEAQAVPRTFKEEDHVGVKSGPTNQAGTSVSEERKDVVPGSRGSGPSKPNQGEETFKQQEQVGVPDPQKPKP